MMDPQRPKGAFGSPGAGVIVGCKSPNMSSRVEAKSSEEQQVFLTLKISLHS